MPFDLFPDQLPDWIAFTLVGTAFFTSAFNATFGLGGGVTLLAAMAQALPVPALVPIHGTAQLGSNVSRAFVFRRHIEWRAVGMMTAGAVIGIALGGSLVVTLPEGVLKLGLAGFILWTVFGAKPKLNAHGSRIVLFLGGLAASFATMFFGATGPLVMAVLATRGMERHRLIATHAATMSIQHGCKTIAFTILGFAFLPWLPFILMLVTAATLGTRAGKSLFEFMPDRWFAVGFKIVMLVLALETALDGVRDILHGED